ncbi:MAG TPA: alpha/beta hydrolase [Candidatus Limnocylindrales bacterium]|nr:alpha/beta hydrolase [Candidatus Limnocylindrales bacterium]
MKDLPATQVATVRGGRVAYLRAGAGTPSIMLIAGAGGPASSWYRLFPEVQELGTVLAWDRPGIGGSERPRVPQIATEVVATLRELLEATGTPPPYVLVGHSFGGLYANLFARLHPAETAAVLFLEATSPDDIGLMTRFVTPVGRVAARVANLGRRPDPLGEVANERETVAQLAAAPPFPEVPAIVLSGGRRPPSFLAHPDALAARDRHQDALARLSPLGERRIAARSGHFPQMSEPATVVAAIRSLVESARLRA